MTNFAVFALTFSVFAGAIAALSLLVYIAAIILGFAYDKAMRKFFPGRWNDE